MQLGRIIIFLAAAALCGPHRCNPFTVAHRDYMREVEQPIVYTSRKTSADGAAERYRVMCEKEDIERYIRELADKQESPRR